MIKYRCDDCHGLFYVNTESMPYDIVGEVDGKKCKEVYCHCPYCLSERAFCISVEEYEAVLVDEETITLTKSFHFAEINELQSGVYRQLK